MLRADNEAVSVKWEVITEQELNANKVPLNIYKYSSHSPGAFLKMFLLITEQELKANKMPFVHNCPVEQCCGTGTVGTVTFCCVEPEPVTCQKVGAGTVINYGSGTVIKWNVGTGTVKNSYGSTTLLLSGKG